MKKNRHRYELLHSLQSRMIKGNIMVLRDLKTDFEGVYRIYLILKPNNYIIFIHVGACYNKIIRPDQDSFYIKKTFSS
jgi:hypothetical protein